jgi:hypothetical protein
MTNTIITVIGGASFCAFVCAILEKHSPLIPSVRTRRAHALSLVQRTAPEGCQNTPHRSSFIGGRVLTSHDYSSRTNDYSPQDPTGAATTAIESDQLFPESPLLTSPLSSLHSTPLRYLLLRSTDRSSGHHIPPLFRLNFPSLRLVDGPHPLPIRDRFSIGFAQRSSHSANQPHVSRSVH